MAGRHLFTPVSLALFIAVVLYVLVSLDRQSPLNVIVITVESLRDDLVDRSHTPNLIRAAESGTRFTNHRAVSGWTGTNIVSLLSGLSPFASGVHTRGQSVSPDRKLPLEMLAEDGYRVEGIQGFMAMDIYRNLGLQVVPQYEDFRYRLSLLADSPNAPFFSWYHYVDTHLPYHTPKGYQTTASRRLAEGGFSGDQNRRLKLVHSKPAIHFYEAAYEPQDVGAIHDLQQSTIMEFDDWFAGFWEFFNRSGLKRSTILIVTADHGDEHGERGMVGHASTTLRGHLYEEVIRIPLFVWLPERLTGASAGVDSNLLSTHEDVMATLLDLLELPHPVHVKGRNLFRSKQQSHWVGMTSSGGFAEPDPARINYFEYGILSGFWKLRIRVEQSGEESLFLYNLNDDPGELKNLAQLHPDRAVGMRSVLMPYISGRTNVEVILETNVSKDGNSGGQPDWIKPAISRSYTYDDLQPPIVLQWSGPEEHQYLLEYRAGSGNKILQGSLKVDGTVKDFGRISRRYWNTWVVPNSPYRLRVRLVNSDQWSEWIEVAAKP